MSWNGLPEELRGAIIDEAVHSLIDDYLAGLERPIDGNLLAVEQSIYRLSHINIACRQEVAISLKNRLTSETDESAKAEAALDEIHRNVTAHDGVPRPARDMMRIMLEFSESIKEAEKQVQKRQRLLKAIRRVKLQIDWRSNISAAIAAYVA